MRLTYLALATLVSTTASAKCPAPKSIQLLSNCAKNLKVLVGVTPGGASDVFAREISKFAKQHALDLIVINKPGASGNIASFDLVKNESDEINDCKFMVGTAASLYLNKFNPQLNPKIDPETEFTPIGLIATNPMFLAVNKRKINALNVDDFIAKTNARAPFYSTPGIGSSNHLMAALMDSALLRKSDYSTHVPAKGASEALALLLRGDVDFVLDNPATINATIGNPNIQIVANTSRTARTIGGIEVPPLMGNKKLANVEGYSSFGVVANRHISKTSAAAMEDLVSCMTQDAAFKAKFQTQGYEVDSGKASKLKSLTAEQLKYWKPVADLVY